LEDITVEYLDRFAHIILLAQENFKIVTYLGTLDSRKHINRLKREVFFDFTSVNAWRVIVLELSKLFSRKEHFSINKLIAEFQERGKFYKPELQFASFEAWEKFNTEHAEDVLNLKKQRDTSYAHSDIIEIRNMVDVHTAQEMLNMSQLVIREIFAKIFNTDYSFDYTINSPVDSLKRLFSSLLERESFYDDLEKGI
jgi:hypothetical protein